MRDGRYLVPALGEDELKDLQASRAERAGAA